MTGKAAISRSMLLLSSKTIVIKVGSAVLTDADGLNLPIFASLARQIASVRQTAGGEPRRVTLVSSGAVAAGKAILKAEGRTAFNNYQKAKHALAAVGQSRLMRAWNEAFAPHHIVTSQVLLTREDFRERRRFQIVSGTFADMLSWGVIPIVNENDTVSVNGIKFGDNDCLASLLVNLVEADLFINLTTANGVLDANPLENPDARVMPCIEDISGLDLDALCGGKTDVGSGGMYSKLLAARRVSQLGVPTLIIPGRKENVLLDAFNDPDDQTGTWVYPAEKIIPRRKFWLAYQSEPAGCVEIDAGAARALLEDGRSLLPGGVVRVDGVFSSGDLLRVTHNGKSLGVGFSNYQSDKLESIRGLKRHEVAAILGQAKYPDVIHRDNLLLDAAIQEQGY